MRMSNCEYEYPETQTPSISVSMKIRSVKTDQKRNSKAEKRVPGRA